MPDNEQKINEIKDSLKEIVQLLIQRGQPLSEDLKILLVQVMEHVANRIQQLRNEEEFPTAIPPLQESYPSSNVNSFSYDEDSGKLFVKFQGDYPQQNGPVYQYTGVPKQIFELFKRGAVPARTDGKNKWGRWWKGKNPSMGSSMYTLIKQGGYPYMKVA